MKVQVDYTHRCDVECVVMAELGWTTKAIASRLGLKDGEVAYRIRKAEAGELRRGYREGTSPTSLKVLGMFGMRMVATTQPRLKERFKCKSR